VPEIVLGFKPAGLRGVRAAASTKRVINHDTDFVSATQGMICRVSERKTNARSKDNFNNYRLRAIAQCGQPCEPGVHGSNSPNPSVSAVGWRLRFVLLCVEDQNSSALTRHS
jgi:hypothetical protein